MPEPLRTVIDPFASALSALADLPETITAIVVVMILLGTLLACLARIRL